MKNRNFIFTTILLTLGSFALPQRTQAVSPPPDGGYPGGNTAEGQNALFGSTISGYNTAIGFSSLASLTDAGFNTGVGAGTLLASIGAENTATGAGALLSNTTGSHNTANGTFALFGNTMGSNNVALGYRAGFNATGSNNVYIGAGIQGLAADDTVCRIGSIFGATITNGIQVLINSDNRLGTMTSSKRFKQNITPTSKSSEALYELQPVRFQYKKAIDPEGRWQFGLVAEDVEKVNPDLVVHDKEGKAYSVRYDQVNAMLLNEFLKDHKKVEEQQTQITELNSKVATQKAIIGRQGEGMELLAAQLKEQGTQIQRVTAQIELSRPAQRTVLSNP